MLADVNFIRRPAAASLFVARRSVFNLHMAMLSVCLLCARVMGQTVDAPGPLGTVPGGAVTMPQALAELPFDYSDGEVVLPVTVARGKATAAKAPVLKLMLDSGAPSRWWICRRCWRGI